MLPVLYALYEVSVCWLGARFGRPLSRNANSCRAVLFAMRLVPLSADVCTAADCCWMLAGRCVSAASLLLRLLRLASSHRLALTEQHLQQAVFLLQQHHEVSALQRH